MNDAKTEKKVFVSGINCEPDIARKQMIKTKKAFGKDDGIVAFHGYQSFKPGEVTAELAHQIGMELAQKMWGDKYEVIVATHLDHAHFHNHLCLNSVSYIDGKKYDERNSEWQRMAKLSDEICLAHGLSIIENPKFGNTLSHDEYMAKKNGTQTNNEIMIRDIDECISASVTMKDFYSRMKEKGYSFDDTHKYTTISHPDFSRPRRLKTLGEDYTESAIERRIRRHILPYEEKIPEQDETDKIFNETFLSYEWPHIRFIYERYTFEINNWIDRPAYNKYKLYLIKDDIKKLDKLIEEQEVLILNDIDCYEKLEAFILNCDSELTEMANERQKLRNKLKTASVNNPEQAEELKIKISSISEAMKKVRHDKKICENVKQQAPEIEAKVKAIEEANEKIRIEKEAKARGIGRRPRIRDDWER